MKFPTNLHPFCGPFFKHTASIVKKTDIFYIIQDFQRRMKLHII